jgi:hypothetical protein
MPLESHSKKETDRFAVLYSEGLQEYDPGHVLTGVALEQTEAEPVPADLEAGSDLAAAQGAVQSLCAVLSPYWHCFS